MSDGRKSVVIADNHPATLIGLWNIVSFNPAFEVLAACRDGEMVLEAIRRHTPDVALVDLKMPRLDGLAVARIAQQEGLGTPIVLLVDALRDQDVFDAVQRGVRGIVFKDNEPSILTHCLRAVASGEESLPSNVREAVDREGARRVNADTLRALLTARELQILALAVEGHSNKEIAFRLNLSEGTVKIHLHHIFRKTGARTRACLQNFLTDR